MIPKEAMQSHSHLGFPTKASGLANLNMASEFSHGQMEPDMKGSGLMGRQAEKGNLFILMEIFMKENGKTIRQMVMEFTHIAMVRNTKVIGEKIFKTAMERKFGLMEVNTKDCIKMEKNMVMEDMCGQMGALMKEVG